MRIQIVKSADGRHRLRCFRDDGSSTEAPVGPGLPLHDLAHYVAETELGLDEGFFGLVARGCSIAELGDRERISSLPPQIWVAETLARAVGALATGACRVDQVRALVEAELAERTPRGLTGERAARMHERYLELVGRYRALSAGESLLLDWG